MHHYSLDILIGGFSKPERISNIYAATNHLYFSEHAIWCVQAAAKTPNWKNICYIFSPSVWTAVATIFLTMVLSMYAYFHKYNNKNGFGWAIMCSIRIHIGFVAECSPKKLIGRIMLFLFLLYGLIMSAIFQSATVSSMTGNYYQKQISTLSEAIDSNFEFAGSNFTYTILLHKNDKVNVLFSFLNKNIY